MPIQDRLPKSRITLTYRTTINGQEQDVDLPFRVLVLGNFSHQTSSDFKVDLDERKIRSVTGGGKHLDKLMADMNISLELKEVPNALKPGASFGVNLKINSMKSFHPDEIVKQVPQLKALRLLRELLASIQSKIDNNKLLRTEIEKLYKKKSLITEMQAQLEAELTQSSVSAASIDFTAAYHSALQKNIEELAKDTTLKDKVKTVSDKFKPLADPATFHQKLTAADKDSAKLTALKTEFDTFQSELKKVREDLEKLRSPLPMQPPSYTLLKLPQDTSKA